jgi:hypothetical protein
MIKLGFGIDEDADGGEEAMQAPTSTTAGDDGGAMGTNTSPDNGNDASSGGGMEELD